MTASSWHQCGQLGLVCCRARTRVRSLMYYNGKQILRRGRKVRKDMRQEKGCMPQKVHLRQCKHLFCKSAVQKVGSLEVVSVQVSCHHLKEAGSFWQHLNNTTFVSTVLVAETRIDPGFSNTYALYSRESYERLLHIRSQDRHKCTPCFALRQLPPQIYVNLRSQTPHKLHCHGLLG